MDSVSNVSEIWKQQLTKCPSAMEVIKEQIEPNFIDGKRKDILQIKKLFDSTFKKFSLKNRKIMENLR